MTAGATPSRGIRYHRHIQGADFSLEANTESVPEAGHFYLLRNGEVLLKSNEFSRVETAYKALCREYWESCLTSESLPTRISSAWGLLGVQPKHRAATAVIKADGTPADCRRMEANLNRMRAQERHNARANESQAR